MNFDFNEARKNNSDEEILNSIKKKSKEYGYDFGATEIIDALDLFQKQRKQNQQIEQNDDDYESNYSDPEIIKPFEDIKTNPEKQDFNQTSTLGQNSNDFINRENFSKSINSLIENIGGIKTGDQEIKINTQEQNLTDENSIQNPLKSQNTQTKSDFREDPKYKGVFYNDKEDTRLSDGFSWQGALNTLTQARDDYTYENKTDKAIYDRLRQNVRIKLQNKAPIEDYTNAEKEILLKDYHIDTKGLSTLNSVLPTALTSQSDALVNASKIIGEKEQEIVNKNLNDLSQEDKEYLKDKAGLLNSTWNKIFHDDDKTIEEEYDKLRGGEEIQEASAAVERLKNFSLDKNLLFAIVSGDKTKQEAKKRFEDDLTKTAEFLGFDNVAIDRINENIFFEKDNKLYKLNDGFFDNFETIMGANVFSIGGGIAGAIKGAKSGKDPKSKIMKGAVYGALGGLGGGGMDYLLQSYRDNKEARFGELVAHSMQEGLLSLVGDGVVLALKPLTSSIKPAMKLVQKAPFINYFTQDLPEQNVNAAKKVVNNWFEPKNREEAKKIIDEMGGGIELENGNFYGNKFVDWVKKKLGENSKTAKIAKHLSNFFMMPNARERQKEVFNLLRASDNGAAILAEVAKSDARAGEKLKEIFNYSTQNLKMQLGNLNLNKDEITDIIKSYESGTSSDYARMEKVLSAAYKNEKVKLDDHVYEKVKNKLMDENLVGEEIDSFLKDLKSSLFDRELSFKQLNNARKNLNSLFSQRQNYGEYLKRVLANELRQTIQGGIEEIFSKNPKMFEKANKLYNDTLEEYGILKELQKMDFFKSAKDPEVNVKEIADKVLNAAKSQGDVLAKFTSKLDKKNQARIELNILDEIFNQSLYKNGKLEVFDSKNFFKRLENAKFHSKEANDYIQIAKNFDRVFGNDANIAGSIGGYKGIKLGTGLATSVEGAAKYQQTRILLNSIIRNLPNPLGLCNDLTGNAALRFHVLKALRKSQTSQEFTNLMEKEIKKMPFTSSSRINLSEFLKDFKELKNKVLESEVIEDDPIYTKELNNPIIPHNRQVELKGDEANFTPQSQKGKSDLENTNQDFIHQSLKDQSSKFENLRYNQTFTDERLIANKTDGKNSNQDLINQSLKDIDFIDNKGEVRTLSKETQKEWCETFGLKSIDEDYSPNLPSELKEALGKEIKLTKGSLKKIVEKGREKYISQIKQTLENADFALRDRDNMLILAKQIEDKQYFTSINLETKDYFISVSNAPKKENILKNKVENGAKIIYQSPNAKSIFYTDTLLQTDKSSANKIDGKNSTQDLINQSLNKFNIFDLYRSKNDFLDIKKLEKSLEKYKESKPQEIKYKTLKRGYILDDLLNVDEDVSYAVVNKDDLKPSLTRSLSQFRNKHSNSTISNIRNSFNEREHFKESSNFDGIPTITKDGLIIAGNHRTTAIKDLKGENLARYIKQAKRVYGEEVFKGFDENKAMIVKILDKNDDDTIIRLSKLSNDGRLSDESEKLQALGAKYKEKLSNIENAKLNSEKELMNFLGSKDVLESRRALLDHLMPDIYNALLAWEKRSGGDSQFSKILSDNALNFLHLKQALNENKVFKDNGNDFFSLFKRAIESMNQSNAYKNSDELYEMLKKYAEPSLNFEKEFIPNDKDLQADILAFIVKYNDTLTNPSEALGLKIQKAIDFIRDNDSFSLFDEIKLSNYDVLNQMLNANIATGTKYQELLNKATSNISKRSTDNKNVLELEENIKSKKAKKSTKNDDHTLQRYDDYLGENKEFNLDYLDKMDLNPVHYNLTREFIINAKKDTLKGIKHDVPSGIRKQIEEKLNINPLKEFGENYTEYYHDGKGALQKLLIEKQGQVAGAFYRDDLAKATGTGEIDLVWGNEKFGLKHILDKHNKDFEDLGKELSEIIAKGEVLDDKGVKTILLKRGDDTYRVGLSQGFEGKGDNLWIITSYKVDKSPRSDSLPSSEVIKGDGTNLHPSDLTNEIIPKIQEKFKFDEKKAKDLYEWHKDSSPLTKNDDGTPKVFYHGSTAKFETFIPNPKSYGIWLTSDKDKAIPHYAKSRNELYSVFVKGKKFYIGDEKDVGKIGFLKEPYTPEAEKMFEKLKRAGYDGIDMSDKNILIVFDSNQIKSIDNAGSWTDSAGKITKEKPSDESARHSYFNAQSPNILHSNEIWSGGLAGGTLNGLETDEDGNIIGFDPAKFVAGFIAGAAGTFAFKKGAKFLKDNPQFKEAVVNELKESLRQGWQGATKKYPILSQLAEPKYIIQNDKGRAIQARHLLNKLEKEQKGLYNVTYNGKNAVLIKKDLEAVDEAILFEKGTKRKGGKHIRLAHSQEPSQEGYVTKQEVANLGVNIREYLKNYEPFIDKNGARIYEWEKEGVRFRVVVNDLQTSGGNSHLPSASEEIITFYSDRNLKEEMNFKNPALEAEDLPTLMKKSNEIREKMRAYKREHNYPEFLGFGENAIKIDDPYYQGLNEELNALNRKIDELRLAEFRARAKEEHKKQEASLKALQEQSTSESPYKDFNTIPKSWKSIEKIKGVDYINDLKQWHEKSHKSSKNTDGSPKVFYHGTRSDKFEVFEAGQGESGREGIYFSTSLNIAKNYDIWKQGVYKVFLYYENPLVLDFKGANYNSKQGGEILKTIPQKLSKKHDAIIYKNIRDDNQNGAGELADTVVVFNPNQIKHIDNKGLKSESGRKYFNEKSENIYHSNPHLGAGLVGGTLNGLETDEDGNIIGFDPAKFVAGFIAGAAGTKAVKLMLNSKAGQNHALKVATNISEDFKALRENNLPLFAKIMQKIEPQTLLKSSKEAKNLSNEIFNKELQNAIKQSIENDKIAHLPQVHFSDIAEFRKLFDENENNIGILNTAIGKVKVNTNYALNHFTNNTYFKDRTKIKSGFFETFKNPLFIVEDTSKGKDSVYFYKPFYDKDKKTLNLFGIGVNEKGYISFKTYYLDEKKTRLNQLLKNEKIKIKYVAKI
ncbi:hypothetical protein HpCK101_09210 [Helicobacter pylori]